MATMGEKGIELSEREAIEDKLGTEVDQREADQSPGRRVAAALNLYLAGANYIEIANTLNYASPQAAQLAVERAMAEVDFPDADKSAARQKMSLQLDMLLKATVPKALKQARDDQLAYVQTTVKILERKAKLLGLDAPTQIAINPDDRQMDTLVMSVLEVAGALPSPEGDPFADIEDAEVVDDSAE
jgi:hypothetical protein